MSVSYQAGRRSIAIVGMGGHFPGARTLEEFWCNLRDGVESLEDFSADEMAAAGVDRDTQSAPGWVGRGSVLEDADRFDASFFDYGPLEAQIIDPQQRLFLETAWATLEAAGYAGEADGRTIGVYAGASMSSYLITQLLPNRTLLATVGAYQVMLGNDKDFLSTRTSYKLDLHGPSLTVQTAGSTSLVAIQLACQALLRHECDMALAGGASVVFPQRGGYRFQHGMPFSSDGRCRPFDVEARGSRPGSGVGVVALKRLEDAIADRDTIQAVILGAAVNNDGAAKANFTDASVDGQLDLILSAHSLAGVAADTIGYVEAHGAATLLGDPIEVAALTHAFRESTDVKGFCAIGSVKANLGHLDAAAGVVSLIKTVLALRHRVLPPQINFRLPNPLLELEESPFRVVTRAEAWPAGSAPRRACVSSFGTGGTNAHVVLEEAPPALPSVVARPEQLLILSAKSATALEATTANLLGYLARPDAAPLADVAYTLQVGRKPFAYRKSVVLRNSSDAVALLSADDRVNVASAHCGASAGTVAFLFSGEGSEYAGMCVQLYAAEEAFRAAVDRCAELLQPHFGRDIRQLLWHGTEGQLGQTNIAQPAIFVVEYALAVLWMSWGVQPAAMLGHGIGEYVAAHLAGVFSLEDALVLAAGRGRMMHGTAVGEMLAVRLSPGDLRARLRPGVEVAAINAPALCSVSGTAEAIEALKGELDRDGVEHRPLRSGQAFHSALMDPVLAPFRELVSRVALSPPRRPMISNLTGTWLRPDQAVSPDYWASQLRGAVLFADGLAALASDPAMQLLEVGPGNTLTAMARLTLGRVGSARVSPSLPHPRETRTEIEAMLSAAGQLWVTGVTLDFEAIHASDRLRRVPLPTYPFERQRHWVESVPTPSWGPAGDGLPTEPAPELTPVTGPDARSSEDAAESAIEAKIAAIWQNLLGVDTVGVDDNFFDLGGHSLMATRVIARIDNQLGVRLPLRELFNAPTIRQLAGVIAAQRVRPSGSAATAVGDREEFEL